MADAPVTIRAYAPADHATAVALMQALNVAENAVSHDRRVDVAGASEHLDGLLPRLADAGGEMLLAVRGDAVLGLVAWLPETDDIYVVESLRRSARVEELVVPAEHRRQGIATLLLAEVEHRARLAGLPLLKVGVLVGNAAAERAYAACGFRPYLSVLTKTLNQP